MEILREGSEGRKVDVGGQWREEGCAGYHINYELPLARGEDGVCWARGYRVESFGVLGGTCCRFVFLRWDGFAVNDMVFALLRRRF